MHRVNYAYVDRSGPRPRTRLPEGGGARRRALQKIKSKEEELSPRCFCGATRESDVDKHCTEEIIEDEV